MQRASSVRRSLGFGSVGGRPGRRAFPPSFLPGDRPSGSRCVAGEVIESSCGFVCVVWSGVRSFVRSFERKKERKKERERERPRRSLLLSQSSEVDDFQAVVSLGGLFRLCRSRKHALRLNTAQERLPFVKHRLRLLDFAANSNRSVSGLPSNAAEEGRGGVVAFPIPSFFRAVKEVSDESNQVPFRSATFSLPPSFLPFTANS